MSTQSPFPHTGSLITLAVMIFAAISNTLALIVISRARLEKKNRSKENVPAFFVKSMVTVDLLSALLTIFEKGLNFTFGDTVIICNFLYASLLTMFFASGFINILMSLERSIAFCAPFLYLKSMTVRRAKKATFLLITVATVIGILPVMGVGSYVRFSVEVDASRGNVSRPKCGMPTGTRSEPGEIPFIVIFFSTGAAMFLILHVCNGVVLWQLMKLTRAKPVMSSTSYGDKGLRASAKLTRNPEIRLAQMVSVVSVIYTISSLPFFIQRLLKALDVPQPDWYLYVVIFLLVSNHVIDPFVFVFMKQQSRDALRDLCMEGICCKKWRTHPGVEANDRGSSGTEGQKPTRQEAETSSARSHQPHA
ncbi:oxytocin receptor-like isoform X2 [Diadema antillarum]|uniref:oxytocin receptor-like isoform X2 n=1 Tax=Diadema antillarum TaxID=105358 RepID=UPI003A87598C